MFSYYLVVFTLISLSFRERRTLCLGLLFILSLLLGANDVGDSATSNYIFYLYMTITEIFLLVTSLLLYNLHESKATLLLFAVSLLVHAVGAFEINPLIQLLLDTHYELINTLLFEVMIGILIANTSWAINLSDKLKGNKPC